MGTRNRDIDQIAGDMGWNSESLLTLAEGFLEQEGLIQKYVEYLGECADEEIEMSGEDEE